MSQYPCGQPEATRVPGVASARSGSRVGQFEVEPARDQLGTIQVSSAARLSAGRTESEDGLCWWAVGAIIGLGVVLFALRLAAPPNLMDQDQERPAAYVLDVVRNGHWVCQRDLSGDITSKPPLWTWLSALATLAAGRLAAWTLYLPGALAGLGTALLVLTVGRRRFGMPAALFAALACLLSPAALKEFGLARTDGVFAFLVTAAAFLAFRAWNLQRGWTWFWIAAAAATLTKGPLGVVLAAGGLWASLWERKSGLPRPLPGSAMVGAFWLLIAAGGWFLLAYAQCGQALVVKMIGKEFVRHALTDGDHHYPGMLFYQPPLYYLARGAPWSLLAVLGLWRVWRESGQPGELRRFERFLFCWFLFGLALFSLSPNQRGDHLWPLMPAGALLAGRELARLVRGYRPWRVAMATTVAVVTAVAGFAVYYFGPHAAHPLVRQTVALKQLAAEIERRGGREFPLSHVDDPMTLQVYLNTLRPTISSPRAAALLRGPEAAFVAVKDLAALQAARNPHDPPFYTLLAETHGQTGSPVRVISNRPELDPGNATAFCFGEVLVRIHNARLLSASEQEFRVAASPQPGAAVFTNEGGRPRQVRVVFDAEGKRQVYERCLAPQESWRVAVAP